MNISKGLGSETPKNGPEHKIRAGAIVATVWKNEQKGEHGPYAFYTVTLERSYKDKDGAWKNTSSLRAADLPKASLVLNKAYEYLMLEKAETIEVKEE